MSNATDRDSDGGTVQIDTAEFRALTDGMERVLAELGQLREQVNGLAARELAASIVWKDGYECGAASWPSPGRRPRPRGERPGHLAPVDTA